MTVRGIGPSMLLTKLMAAKRSGNRLPTKAHWPSFLQKTIRENLSFKTKISLPCATSSNASSATDEASLRGLMKDMRRLANSFKKKPPEIERVRGCCIAEDSEGHTLGICAVGTAFCIARGLYAISIPMPTIRFSAKSYSKSSPL